MGQLRATLKQELYRDNHTHSKYPQSTYMAKDHFLLHFRLLQQLFQINLLILHSSVRHHHKSHSVGQNPTTEVFRLLNTISTGIRDLERHSLLRHNQHLLTIQQKLTWRLRLSKQVSFTLSQFPQSIVLEKDHNLCPQLLTSQRKFHQSHFSFPRFPLIKLKSVFDGPLLSMTMVVPSLSTLFTWMVLR